MMARKVIGRLFKKYGILSVAAITAAISLQAVSADTFTWTGGDEGDWNATAENWSGGVAWPAGNGHIAVFNTPGASVMADGVIVGGMTFHQSATIGGNFIINTAPLAISLGGPTVSAVIDATYTGINGLAVSGLGSLTINSKLPNGAITVTDGAVLR